jgi:hypothetical protein
MKLQWQRDAAEEQVPMEDEEQPEEEEVIDSEAE